MLVAKRILFMLLKAKKNKLLICLSLFWNAFSPSENYLQHRGGSFRVNSVRLSAHYEPSSLTKQISMNQCHQIPEHPKQEPGPCKRGGEHEELVAPLHVQESCPEVPEVQCPSSAYMLNTDIASSIFGEDAAPPSQSIGPSRSCSCSTCTSTSSPPRGAQQRLGDVSLCLGVAYFLRRGTLRGGGSCGGHGWHYQEGRKQGQQEVNRRRVDKGGIH